MYEKAISEIEKKLNNENITVREFMGEIEICIVPYDREITIEYACFLLGTLMTVVKDFFVVSVEGYNIDGLDETNSLLVHDGSAVCCNYTKQCLKLAY